LLLDRSIEIGVVATEVRVGLWGRLIDNEVARCSVGVEELEKTAEKE
jgi:hypothetical protein